MVSRIVVGLLFCSMCFGQSGGASTSIYINLYSNAAVASPSNIVPNIGQVGHQVFLVFTNAPAHTCTAVGNSIAAKLEFSYDQANWFVFGVPTSNPTISVLSQTYFGKGGYPFVRFNLGSFDTTNCRATAFYTGSSSAADLGTSIYTVGTTLLANTIIDIQGGISSQQAQPLRICEVSDISSTPQAAGTVALESLPASGFGSTLGYCGIQATSTGVSTIQLVQGTGPTCTTPTALSPIYNLVAGVPINFGSVMGIMFYAFGVLGDHVCLTVTGVATNYSVFHTVI